MKLFESSHRKGAVESIDGCQVESFKHVRSMKVVPSNADEFASHANKVVEGIKITYQETSHISGTLKEALAIQVTGTQKV